MKIKKKAVLGSIALILSISLAACGNNTDLEEETEEKYMVEGEEEPIDADRLEEINTINRIIGLVNDLVDNKLENVHFLDSKIVPEIEEPQKVHIADIHLFINEDDKDKAEKFINDYSKIIMEEFDNTEDYEEVILIWTSPNHNKDNAIELEYYE